MQSAVFAAVVLLRTEKARPGGASPGPSPGARAEGEGDAAWTDVRNRAAPAWAARLSRLPKDIHARPDLSTDKSGGIAAAGRLIRKKAAVSILSEQVQWNPARLRGRR